ncbi:formate dehydrogenase subunit delta [Celeribacter persicus]|jgi:NADH-dependant formate dehydrogenase delta subunit FdsD.|uniref:Formate dehydrogenase subunit delta n=1 Tax=Celeribacter persicus TaxID=1651082 RepID=A0A2T5HW68_9RHOB|nr:formate dehydrogenase subunit delta [Celeribacter persicus]PTQ75843.1 formate dehydrogenase subunit delta [Celeribacter persicus]
MTDAKMVLMANQIASFFETQPGDQVAGVAVHLKDFWEPRMISQLKTYLGQGGEGLHALVVEAGQAL